MHALKPPCQICGNLDEKETSFVENNAKVCRIQCNACKTIYFDRQPPYQPKYDLKYNMHFFRPGDIRKAGIMAAEIAEIATNEYFGARVLEAGTGNGLTVFLLNQMNIYSEAVDLDPQLAQFLHERYKITVHISPFEELKTETTWTIIYSSHVIEHTEDPKTFLKKAYDLLCPGGTLLLETPDVRFRTRFMERWHHFKTRDPYEHRYLFSTEGMYLLLSNLGFEAIRIESLPAYTCLRALAKRPK